MAEKPALERLAQALLGYHGEHMIGGEQEIRDATYHVHHAVNLAGSEHYIVMSPRQVEASIEKSLVMIRCKFSRERVVTIMSTYKELLVNIACQASQHDARHICAFQRFATQCFGGGPGVAKTHTSCSLRNATDETSMVQTMWKHQHH